MRWPEKRWQYVAVASDDVFVAVAIAHLGYLGVAFAYAYDRRSGAVHEHGTKMPLALGVAVGREPSEASRLSLPGIVIDYEPAAGSLKVRSRAFAVELHVSRSEPWDATWSIPTAGTHRTRKAMGGPATGQVRLGAHTFEVGGLTLSDWSRGHLARETTWRWAAGAGRADGARIAWNLRTGFDDPAQVENACWVDGRVSSPGLAIIAPGEPWRIEAGPLHLTFTPDGERREDVQLGIIASRYRQPWGRFTGTYAGRPLEGYGVVEDHWARW